MSYLAHELNRLLREHNLTGAELAFRTGLIPAQISRWRNAEQISIKPDTLNQLASGFTKPMESHARLLFATLKDACVGPGETYISLDLNVRARTDRDAASNERDLAPKVKDDLEIIAKNSQNRKIRDLIHAVANLCPCDESNRKLPVARFPIFLKSTDNDFEPSTSTQFVVEPKLEHSEIENYIKSSEARRKLGIGQSLMSAIKRRMGLRGRKYVRLSDIQKWRLQNPHFQESEVYHRPNCACRDCDAKRTNPNRRGQWRNRKKQEAEILK
jgi:transcriptional regulator with XRE-family HTH domain